jgi:hypothetical protein
MRHIYFSYIIGSYLADFYDNLNYIWNCSTLSKKVRHL